MKYCNLQSLDTLYSKHPQYEVVTTHDLCDLVPCLGWIYTRHDISISCSL